MKLITPSLPKNATEYDRIFAAISDITGRILKSVVCESNKYCFKCFDDTIHIIDMKIVDDFIIDTK